MGRFNFVFAHHERGDLLVVQYDEVASSGCVWSGSSLLLIRRAALVLDTFAREPSNCLSPRADDAYPAFDVLVRRFVPERREGRRQWVCQAL